MFLQLENIQIITARVKLVQKNRMNMELSEHFLMMGQFLKEEHLMDKAFMQEG